MTRIQKVLVLIIFFNCVAIQAQEYLTKQYNISDGLVQSTVRSLCQDSLGFIWLGTKNGVSRFDGDEFFNIAEPKDFFKEQIITIQPGFDSNIYMLNRVGKLAFFDGDSICMLVLPDSLGEAIIKDFEFYDEEMILGTERNGIFILNGETVIQLDEENGLYSSTILNLYNYDSELYVITANGINLYRNNRILPFYKNESIEFTTVLKYSDNKYLFGSRFWGLFHFDGVNLQRNHKISSKGVFDIKKDFDDNIWVAKENGLDRIVVDKNGELEITNERKAFYIKELLVDKQNNI